MFWSSRMIPYKHVIDQAVGFLKTYSLNFSGGSSVLVLPADSSVGSWGSPHQDGGNAEAGHCRWSSDCFSIAAETCLNWAQTWKAQKVWGMGAGTHFVRYCLARWKQTLGGPSGRGVLAASLNSLHGNTEIELGHRVKAACLQVIKSAS